MVVSRFVKPSKKNIEMQSFAIMLSTLLGAICNNSALGNAMVKEEFM